MASRSFAVPVRAPFSTKSALTSFLTRAAGRGRSAGSGWSFAGAHGPAKPDVSKIPPANTVRKWYNTGVAGREGFAPGELDGRSSRIPRPKVVRARHERRAPRLRVPPQFQGQ